MAAFVAAACRRPRCRHHCCGHFLPRHCRRRRDVGHLGVLCGRHPLPPLCGGRPLRFGSGARTSGVALGPLADDPLSPQRPPPLPRSLLRFLIASLHPSVCRSAAPAVPASGRGGPPFRHAVQRHGATPIPSSAVCVVGGGGGVSVWAGQSQARPPLSCEAPAENKGCTLSRLVSRSAAATHCTRPSRLGQPLHGRRGAAASLHCRCRRLDAVSRPVVGTALRRGRRLLYSEMASTSRLALVAVAAGITLWVWRSGSGCGGYHQGAGRGGWGGRQPRVCDQSCQLQSQGAHVD